MPASSLCYYKDLLGIRTFLASHKEDHEKMKMLMFQNKLLLMFNYVKDFANFELS